MGVPFVVAQVKIEPYEPHFLLYSDNTPVPFSAVKRAFFKTGAGDFIVEFYRAGVWRPLQVQHDLPRGSVCPFCSEVSRGHWSLCAGLQPQIDEIFDAALRHPSVRLKSVLSIRPIGAFVAGKEPRP